MPVTASFIIAAAVVAPALVALGVEDFAAYMFIFYYAVLSEVSPPTALSAFAAAAITGGNGFRTMMLTCRYTLPRSSSRSRSCSRRRAKACCCKAASRRSRSPIVVSIIAVIALGLALEGWLKGEIAIPARVVIGIAALLLLWLEPAIAAIGLACWRSAWRCTSRRAGARPTSRRRAAASRSQSARSSRDDGGASLVLALVDEDPRGVGVIQRGDDRLAVLLVIARPRLVHAQLRHPREHDSSVLVLGLVRRRSGAARAG